MNYRHRFFVPAFMIMLALALSACGGSSGLSAPAETSSTDWDSMNWDQGTWN